MGPREGREGGAGGRGQLTNRSRALSQQRASIIIFPQPQPLPRGTGAGLYVSSNSITVEPYSHSLAAPFSSEAGIDRHEQHIHMPHRMVIPAGIARASAVSSNIASICILEAKISNASGEEEYCGANAKAKTNGHEAGQNKAMKKCSSDRTDVMQRPAGGHAGGREVAG